MHFYAFESLGIPTLTRIHPAIEFMAKDSWILRQGKLQQQKVIVQLEETELLIATATLLHINPLVEFHSAISPNMGLLRENFSRLYYATGFIRTLRNPSADLPGYSITPNSNDLSSLFDGWLGEIEDEKKKLRKKFRDETLSKLEERYNKRLKTRIYAGRQLFHQLIDFKVLEWLFDRMGIPEDDWDVYRKIMYNDIWENLRTADCAKRLLELEQYLEAWFSLGVHKPIVHKRLHHQLSEFLDMGGSLPVGYYTKNSDGEIESPNFGSLESFKKIIKPKLAFSPVFTPVTQKSLSTKPVRGDYGSVPEFARALVEWSRKNNLG
jgi:hypothetical protein